jgi:hypothetical protein
MLLKSLNLRFVILINLINFNVCTKTKKKL